MGIEAAHFPSRSYVVAAEPERGGVHDIRADAFAAGVWEPGVPVVVCGHEQESYASLVRHEDMWEPDEGEAVQAAA